MSSTVVLASNFNTKKVSFTTPKVLESGGKQAYINYDGGMFVFQTPNCRLPYGMSVFDKAGPIKYTVELSLADYDKEGTKMKVFHDALAKLDDFMIDEGVRNSKAWFRQELPRDVIKAFYSPMIRKAVDKEGNPKPYPPTIKLSLRQKRDAQKGDAQKGDANKFAVTCFDNNKIQYKDTPLEELLVKNTQMTCLIHCTGVWFAGSKYGLSWKLDQAVITSLPQTARNFTFVDDGDFTFKGKGGAGAAAPVAQEESEAEEDEDESEEEEEDAAFSAPPPAAKPSAVAAVMPKAQPKAPEPVAESIDDAADDAEPVPVPKAKTVKTVPKKIVKK
jgi:hypothetical protein